MMRRAVIALIYGILCFAIFIPQATAIDIMVVVNPSSSLDEVTAMDVSKVFMGRMADIEGVKLEPIDQLSNSAVREAFSEKILGRNVRKVKDYWKKRVFSGNGEPPSELNNDAKVIAYVADNPGAIGYIAVGSLTDKVKAVGVDGKTEW
ncbi:MAG: phosphate ABC transporter substrate-binding protein [candidate division Zixibacteria bacterium]|nr:phosphate ABC transporter substrate-binding protein [candidate division Zixibacteria bacterium]